MKHHILHLFQKISLLNLVTLKQAAAFAPVTFKVVKFVYFKPVEFDGFKNPDHTYLLRTIKIPRKTSGDS